MYLPKHRYFKNLTTLINPPILINTLINDSLLYVETSPNWGRTMDSEDEEISAMFDLGLDLPDNDLFPSSDLDDYDGEDDDIVYGVKGPFSRM